MPASIAPVRLAHAVLFAVAICIALLDVVSLRLVGALVGDALTLPLAAIAIGLIRETRDRAGWRPLLAAGDIGIAVAAFTPIARPALARFTAVPVPALVLLGALSLLAIGSVAVGRRRPGGLNVTSTIVRTPRHRTLVILLSLLWIGYLVAIVVSRPPEAQIDLVDLAGALAAPLSVAFVILVAWWQAVPLLLGLVAATSLAADYEFASLALTSVQVSVYLAFAIVGIVAAFIGPRESVPAERAKPHRPGRSPAAVWLGVGAILYVPTVFFGLFVPGFIDCFESCPKPMPGGAFLLPVTLASLALVPIVALLYATAGDVSTGSARRLLALCVAAGILVLVEIGIGMADLAPFAYLAGAAPAATLVALGSGVGLVRPERLAGAGAIAALAAALASVVWMGGTLVGRGGFVLLVAGIATGAIMALAIARESAVSGAWTASPPDADAASAAPPGADPATASVDAISG